MTNYTRGRSFEYRVKEWYERRGYVCVRMAGSHSSCDLIAWRSGETEVLEIMRSDDVVLIQCKRGKKKSYKKAKDELLAVKAPQWWRRELWESEGKKTYVHDLSQSSRKEVKINS